MSSMPAASLPANSNAGGGFRNRGRSKGPDAVPEASAGAAVDTTYRDHVRSLQLFRQALTQAKDDAERSGIWSAARPGFPR